MVIATLGAFLALPSTPAQAHQPVELTASDPTPARGPLLVDGTVSYAVYSTVSRGTTRGFRVGLRAGDRLEIQLLIPDRAPANELAAAQLPHVSITDPTGQRTTLPISERTAFFEPYSKQKYLYLSRLSTSAKAGTYRVTVTGRSSTQVPAVVAVGYREVPGQVDVS